MRIIISPAKKMNRDPDSFPVEHLPQFIHDTEQLLHVLQSMSYDRLKELWRCNDAIARQNVQRLQTMDLRQSLTPAIVAYEGIQYRYMAPGVFTDAEFSYIKEHLRILSGFYGILRPFDGVTPYRLEMQAKLETVRGKDLYAFWGNALSRQLEQETNVIVNLASKEYSQCISRHLSSGTRFLTCVFGEEKNEKIIEKGTMCKMARGEMVRYLARNQIETPEDIRSFHRLNYRFHPELSQENTYVFLKEPSPLTDPDT